MDLKLDSSGDIMFVNGQCPATREKAEVVAQRLRIRFRTFYGEWFLTEAYGIPYLERILGHKVKKSVVDSIIHEEIRKVRGVAEITYFSSTQNNGTRTYRCEFRVKTDNGQETEMIAI